MAVYEKYQQHLQGLFCHKNTQTIHYISETNCFLLQLKKWENFL